MCPGTYNVTCLRLSSRTYGAREQMGSAVSEIPIEPRADEDQNIDRKNSFSRAKASQEIDGLQVMARDSFLRPASETRSLDLWAPPNERPNRNP